MISCATDKLSNQLILCLLSGSRAADMDDILIVSSNQSQAAASWVDYLKVCFDQINKTRKRPPFK